MTKTGFCSCENDRPRRANKLTQLVKTAQLLGYSTNSKDVAVLKMLLHFFTFVDRGKNDNDRELHLFSLSYVNHFGVNVL